MGISDWYNNMSITVPSVSPDNGNFSNWYYGNDYKTIYVSYECGCSLEVDTSSGNQKWR
jgi:hypothetical protein